MANKATTHTLTDPADELHREALQRASALLGRPVTDPAEAYKALEIPRRRTKAEVLRDDAAAFARYSRRTHQAEHAEALAMDAALEADIAEHELAPGETIEDTRRLFSTAPLWTGR